MECFHEDTGRRALWTWSCFSAAVAEGFSEHAVCSSLATPAKWKVLQALRFFLM